MKYLIRLLSIFTVLAALLPLELRAQTGVSSSGTEYWVGFMPNGVQSLGMFVQLRIFVASGTANRVTVTTGTGARTVTMAANTIADLEVDDFSITSQSEVITDGAAVHIVSVNPVTVYGYSVWTCSTCIGGSPDGFLALPITGYGTDYYTVNFPDGTFGSTTSGEFLVIAPYDNTTVTITPKCDTKGGHQGDKPWSVHLDRGQTYLVMSPGTSIGNNDLTGSHIVSSKPVAVMTGHQISSVPTDWVRSADHFLEMIAPTDRWGTQYFDMPMAGRTACGDYIRIVSAEDGNQITYNGKGPYMLNAGEFVDNELTTDPTVFTSINKKKFIISQYSYSQGVNGDPGSADPFMILFMPQEQFENEMIFRTPSPAKSGTFFNYVTFITQMDSIRKITINGLPITNYTYQGLAQFPATNPPMGAYRVQLPGGPNNYIAKGPTPFGAYQYGFANYEGYGWPTGMAVRIVSPDTLPPLLKILDSTCGNYTFKLYEPRTKTNGFSFDDTRIAYFSLVTDPGDSRWPTPSFNYSLVPDAKFVVGDSTTIAQINVTDPTQDAYAALYTVDRAGNDTVYEFHYYAPQVAMSPQSPFDFGSVVAESDSCMTLRFSNIQQAGDFHADSANMMALAKGGYFTVTPNKLGSIPAGKAQQITLCYHPTDTGYTSIDTMLLTSECVPYKFVARGIGVTPLIYTSDINFGEVDSGQTLCKPLTIRNQGKAPLTITSQDLLNNSNFSVDPNQKFPIVLQPNESRTIQYCFHPQSWGVFSAHVNFLNQNPSKFQHSIKDTSLLLGISQPAGAKLTSYVKNFTIACHDTTLLDTLYNNLPNNATVDSVGLVGADAKYFSIVSQQPPYPFVLAKDSGNNIPFTVRYDPMVSGFDYTTRTVTLQVYMRETGLVPPALTITAQLVTPRVAFSTNAVDLGSSLVGHASSSTFTITNSGNAPLDIAAYNVSGPDAASFTLTPVPPFSIGAGAQQTITVTANSPNGRTLNAQLAMSSGCDNAQTSLSASFYSIGDTALGTTHPKTYIECRDDVQNAIFANTGSRDDITVEAAAITAANGWTNSSDFSVSGFQATVAKPGDTIRIPVSFTPTSTGARSAALLLTLKGKAADGTDSVWTETVQVSGQGVGVQRTFAVGAVAQPPTYHAAPATVLSVPIVVDAPINANAPDNGTTEAYGYRFDVSWKRDVFRYEDVTPAMTVSAATYDAASDMETRTFTYSSTTAMTSGTTLATLSLDVPVSVANGSPITVSNASWLAQDGTPLCYVANTVQSGTFVLDPVCGSTTLQTYLDKGTVPSSLGRLEPNPAHGDAQLEYSVSVPTEITISVLDIMGNEVKRIVTGAATQPGTHKVQLPLGDLPSGTYFCRLTDGSAVATKQFEIQK